MNPLLIFVASLLRHAVVTGLSWITLMFSLPAEVREQVEGAADFVTSSLISLLVWVVVKYGKPIITKWGLLPLILIGVTLSLTSCSYVDQVVDTRGSVATAPDTDLDGIPDEITVPSNQVKPVLNEKGLDQLNAELADIIIHAAK